MAKEKGQRTNKDLQNIVFKTKDRVARTPLKTGSCSNYYQMLLSCNTY